MKRSELKFNAKEKLHNNWAWGALMSLMLMLIAYLVSRGIMFLMFGSAGIFGFMMAERVLTEDPGFVISLFVSFAGFIYMLSFGISIITGMFNTGVQVGYLHLVDNQKENNVFKNIFLAFRGGRTYNYFVNVLLTSIFTGLWSLLFIIPGIVKSYSYAMTFYILEDMHKAGKEVGVTEAITKSRQMMKGHKFQLFVLDLSFIGWGILATLALGIGWLWLVPYIQTTKAEFYRKLAANN